ncbi:MAG: glycosyltransferase, partial [Bacilli bacterium]
MKRIIFGITNLEVGGAERVLVDLANKLKNEYEITIFTIYGNGDLLKELNKDIKVISLTNKKYNDLSSFSKKRFSFMFSSKMILNLIYSKYIKNHFDTEIAFLEGPITSLFACKSDSRKIAWVHTNMAKHVKSDLRKQQYEKDYQTYNQIIFVSHDALDNFNNLFEVSADKKVIYNYMDTNSVIKKSLAYVPKEMKKNTFVPSFVSVCRLVTAKGIDRLLLVSKKLIEDGYNHKIYIVGDGPEYNYINNLINKLEMKEYFILIGKKDNPYPYMKRADYFILPSVYEGFGMVLIEAMCLGKTIIITNTGAKE